VQFSETVRRPDAADTGGSRAGLEQPAAVGALLMEGGAALNEYAAKRCLREYDIPVTREYLVRSSQEALEAARTLGLPVVMKIQSADILHKSEIGGVMLDIRTEAQVVEAYDMLLERARTRAAHARLDGVLVQEVVEGAVEMIVGMVDDPVFGPVLTVGLGGIHTEVLRDVASHVGLVAEADARRMLASLKAYPILTGVRGRARADIDALVDVMQKVSLLGMQCSDAIAEIEINPLAVLSEGRGVRALDALITKHGMDQDGPAG